MLRNIAVTFGLVVLWVVVVCAVVLGEAYWFAAPEVTRGDFASIERHLAGKIGSARARGKIGAAGLVMIRRGEIVAEPDRGRHAPPVRGVHAGRGAVARRAVHAQHRPPRGERAAVVPDDIRREERVAERRSIC